MKVSDLLSAAERLKEKVDTDLLYEELEPASEVWEPLHRLRRRSEALANVIAALKEVQ